MEHRSSACVDPGSYAISIFGRHDKDGDGSLNRTAPQCQLQLLWPAAMPAARDGPGRTFLTLERGLVRLPKSHTACAVQPHRPVSRAASRDRELSHLQSHLPQRLQEAAALIDDFCNTLGLDLAAREKDNLINQQARG